MNSLKYIPRAEHVQGYGLDHLAKEMAEWLNTLDWTADEAEETAAKAIAEGWRQIEHYATGRPPTFRSAVHSGGIRLSAVRVWVDGENFVLSHAGFSRRPQVNGDEVLLARR